MSTERIENGGSSIPHRVGAPTRRDFLFRAGGGFGGLALMDLLARDNVLSAAPNAAATKAGQPRPRAKSAIFLFMDGGPSHLDLFDPKPAIQKLAGKPLPQGIERAFTPMGVSDNPILPTKRTFRRYGKSGIPVSDWMPHVAEHVDDIAVIRSCWADGLNHVGSVCQMNTGSILAGRPSLGSWISYGLGRANEDLPAFVVMLDRPSEPPGGPRNWGTGFMSANYQGTQFRDGPTPIFHLNPPADIGAEQQRGKLDLLLELNRLHAVDRSHQRELDARIESYELAYRMQSAAPEAVDLSRETAKTRELYGLDEKETTAFGRSCLMARRLVERGVRFVQLYSGSGSAWDAHAKIEKNHSGLCRSCDKPIAALLGDLKTRGLLAETLVIWGGEFGRTPMSEKGDGRDHNPYGFTMWMAGGGVKGGRILGKTDDVGLHAVEDRIHVHDLHATILHILGLDPEQLTFVNGGREENLTMNLGRPVARLLG